MKNRVPFTEEIRQAIRSSGLTRYRICKEIGITQPTMTRFMQGTSGLALDTLDRIAELLDLHVTAGARRKPRPRKGE